MSGHVVIVGYGLAGRFAARSLSACGVPVVVLELNADNVRKGRELGLPIHYADATSEEALGHAHLADASLLVLLMNDPLAAQRVVDTARRVAPSVPVLMRTRYLAERNGLLSIGAHDVVAEEVESAVEVIDRMLRWLEVPRNVIEERIETVRSETQTSVRRQVLPRRALVDTRGLDELKIESALVRERSNLVGKSPSQIRFRTETGALVVGVRRGDRLLEQPDPNVPFDAGDVVYMVGTREAVRRALEFFGDNGAV